MTTTFHLSLLQLLDIWGRVSSFLALTNNAAVNTLTHVVRVHLYTLLWNFHEITVTVYA